ncbi:MAG TPA: DUF2071 domain-containing protein [Pyrinomonadaceae bacterium]|nr:DUF2071 domain-containing protein [Pyrinomonadaceae bacterium]
MNVDRLTICRRPRGLPLLRQWWGKLLFMHWPVPAELLRPLVPRPLTLDTFEGRAWLGVVPFTMWGIRQSLLPPLPGTSAFHELNVRTYVHFEGTPGVWFLSLDAANALAVWGARQFFHLPYFNARMNLRQQGNRITFQSRRTHRDSPPAEFEAVWTYGDALAPSETDSLAFFLTERYCLYAAHNEELYRCRIHHERWPLRRAALLSLHSTMTEAHGLPTPDGPPLLHYAEALKTDIWPPERLRRHAPVGILEASGASGIIG